MSEKETKESPVGTLEINNVKELDEKLSDAIENSENKPSEEEVEAAKVEFEEGSKNFSVKSWDIGEDKDGLRNCQYITHFVKNRVFWTKNGWMGVLKMMEELEDAEKFIIKNPGSALKLGYQALEFAFYAFQNPGGIGYQAAKDLEEESEDYARVFDGVGASILEARKELKEIQFLQDRYAAMQQGFYLEIEPGEDEELEPECPECEDEKAEEKVEEKS